LGKPGDGFFPGFQPVGGAGSKEGEGEALARLRGNSGQNVVGFLPVTRLKKGAGHQFPLGPGKAFIRKVSGQLESYRVIGLFRKQLEHSSHIVLPLRQKAPHLSFEQRRERPSPPGFGFWQRQGGHRLQA
jgi:hypothetical protein